MKSPLAALMFAFCLGIFVASKIKIPFLPIYLTAFTFLALTTLSFKKGLRFDILILCLVFLLGAVFLNNAKILPKCHISRFIFYKDNGPYTIKGVIISQPQEKHNKTSFVFKTARIESNNFRQNCCGSILVYARGKLGLDYAEELVLKGNLYRPFSLAGNKRQNYREFLYNQGIYSIMNAGSLTRLNKNKGTWLNSFALRLKARMEGILFRRASGLSAGILDAMILGEKRNIPALISSSMIKSGTIHIFPKLYTKMPSTAL